MSPHALYDALWERKLLHQAYAGYAELTRPVLLLHWAWPRVSGEVQARAIETPCTAGQTVRIVMVSRFGDMGITDRLDDQYGYAYRTRPEEGLLTNCRLHRDPTP